MDWIYTIRTAVDQNLGPTEGPRRWGLAHTRMQAVETLRPIREAAGPKGHPDPSSPGAWKEQSYCSKPCSRHGTWWCQAFQPCIPPVMMAAIHDRGLSRARCRGCAGTAGGAGRGRGQSCLAGRSQDMIKIEFVCTNPCGHTGTQLSCMRKLREIAQEMYVGNICRFACVVLRVIYATISF